MVLHEWLVFKRFKRNNQRQHSPCRLRGFYGGGIVILTQTENIILGMAFFSTFFYWVYLIFKQDEFLEVLERLAVPLLYALLGWMGGFNKTALIANHLM